MGPVPLRICDAEKGAIGDGAACRVEDHYFDNGARTREPDDYVLRCLAVELIAEHSFLLEQPIDQS